MAYIRKTFDEWWIFQYYEGSGWEHIDTEGTRGEAKAQARSYRENQPYPVKIQKKRIRREHF